MIITVHNIDNDQTIYRFGTPRLALAYLAPNLINSDYKKNTDLK